MALEYDFAENRFTPWDYVVFVILLVVSSVIGLYYGCTGNKQSSTEEFLMAGRSMGIFPVAMSMLASFMSAITLLGTPAEIAVFGTQYWMIWLSYCLVIPLSAHLFVPLFYRLNVTSVFEYLEMRFSKGVRVYASLVYIVQMMIYLALVLYAPCLALSVVTGLNKWIAVLSVGLVCTFYTTIGGMKAVMWTDVVQVFLMFAGLIGVIIKGSNDHGGFSEIWNLMLDNDRVKFFDFSADPMTRHTTWSLVIGGTFTWLAIYGVNQAMVQRALCTPTCRQGQIAMWLNLPGLVAILSLAGLCGSVVFSEYVRCDPVRLGRIQGRDQLLPLYVMDKMHFPGFPGLFTACIMSGSLSTISSGLNSLAAVFLQDLMLGLCCKNLTASMATLASKLISVSFGIVMILLTIVASELGGLLQAALGIFGMIGGPLLGVFVLGIIYPWANTKGAYFGLTAGLVLTIWLGVGAQVFRPPIKGHVPSPMSTAGCALKNTSSFEIMFSDNDTDTSAAGPVFTEIVEDSTRYMDGNGTTLPFVSSVELKAGYLSFYQISYMWYSAFAVFVTSVGGLLFSFITGHTQRNKIDPKLLSPVVDILCRMPAKCVRLVRNCIELENNDCGDEQKKKTQCLENDKGYTNHANTCTSSINDVAVSTYL